MLFNLIANVPLTQTGLWYWTWQASTKSHGLPKVQGFTHWWFTQANWMGQSLCVVHFTSNETNVH